MRRNSLRTRLTIWFTGVLVTVALLGGGSAYILVRHDPDRFLDDQLRQVALNVGDPAGNPEQAPDPSLDPSDILVVQTWDGNGSSLRSAPPELSLPRQPVTGFSDLSTKTDQWRTYTAVTGNGTLQVSQRAAVRRELALEAALPSVITVAALIPLSWLLVSWLVGRILMPLEELARQLSARQPDNTQFLAVHDMPEEIVPLVKAINTALDRLRDALMSQRRFVSDAAHQLRTPVTALRLQVRNLKRSPETDDSEILDDMDLGLQRMSALTGQLLALARAEASATPALQQQFPVRDALDQAVSAVRPLAQRKSVAIECASSPDLQVRADRHDLIMLFCNVIDNAVRYTPVGGRVELSVHASDELVTVTVVDSGPGLPEDMLVRVFDRFVRQAEDGDGTGLGLSIAKAIADRTGARVWLRNRIDRSGLIARVEIPMSL
jgi:two-component system OmpR family sensor kinase